MRVLSTRFNEGIVHYVRGTKFLFKQIGQLKGRIPTLQNNYLEPRTYCALSDSVM